jgi:integration host factor subunit beta
MIKSELVTRLTVRHALPNRHVAEQAVQAVLKTMSSALAAGRRIELRGFGAFAVKQRMARAGRNPRSGVPVAVGPRRHPLFRCGKEMKERLNAGGRTGG